MRTISGGLLALAIMTTGAAGQTVPPPAGAAQAPAVRPCEAMPPLPTPNGVLAFAPGNYAGKRLALVVGIGVYDGNERRDLAREREGCVTPDALANSIGDATLVANTFRDLAFDEVRQINDPDRSTILRAIAELGQAGQTADLIAFYFAGHGGDYYGHQFLVPARVRYSTPREAFDRSVRLGELYKALGQSNSVKLLLLDSGRASLGARYALTDRLVNEVTYIDPPVPIDNMIVAFATSSGEPGIDGYGHANGPFASSIARRFQERGEDIAAMMTRVTRDVRAGTNGKQNALLFSSLPEGRFYLKPQRMIFADQPRLALVIGNGDYNRDNDYDDHKESLPVRQEGYASDLPNTLNDARDLRNALTRIRFTDVVYAENADKATMTAKLLEFRQKVREAGPSALVVIYYAGHAIQVNGANFLVPVGAKLPPLDLTRMSEPDVELALRDYAFPVNDLVTSLRNPDGQGANIVILDACRNNPWELRTRAVGGGATRGLADIPVALQRTAIAFATKPGDTALDGEGQSNSPYMTVMKQWIERPGLSIRDLFDGVGNEVVRATNNRQVPWFNTPPLGATCLGACPEPP